MSVIAIYPGTFDPITYGHTSIIERACRLFERVIIAILNNPQKKTLLNIEQRLHLAQTVLSHYPNIEPICFDGLLTDFARQQQARVIIRGLRNTIDFAYESQLAWMNQRLAPQLDTLFLSTSEQYAQISSSLVKEIIHYGGDISAFVPPEVQHTLQQQFNSSY